MITSKRLPNPTANFALILRFFIMALLQSHENCEQPHPTPENGLQHCDPYVSSASGAKALLGRRADHASMYFGAGSKNRKHGPTSGLCLPPTRPPGRSLFNGLVNQSR